jgi:hypothetical protein
MTQTTPTNAKGMTMTTAERIAERIMAERMDDAAYLESRRDAARDVAHMRANVAAAKAWLKANVPGVSEAGKIAIGEPRWLATVDAMAQEQMEASMDRNYAGGWFGFVLDKSR